MYLSFPRAMRNTCHLVQKHAVKHHKKRNELRPKLGFFAYLVLWTPSDQQLHWQMSFKNCGFIANRYRNSSVVCETNIICIPCELTPHSVCVNHALLRNVRILHSFCVRFVLKVLVYCVVECKFNIVCKEKR